jgi:hypothetical protein
MNLPVVWIAMILFSGSPAQPLRPFLVFDTQHDCLNFTSYVRDGSDNQTLFCAKYDPSESQ